MRERLKHHEAALAAMENGDLDTMQAAAQNGMEAEDLERLRADIATTTEDINGAPTPLPLPPDMRYRNVSCFGKSERIATWHEAPDKVWRLRRRQLIAYELLQDAGDKFHRQADPLLPQRRGWHGRVAAHPPSRAVLPPVPRPWPRASS